MKINNRNLLYAKHFSDQGWQVLQQRDINEIVLLNSKGEEMDGLVKSVQKLQYDLIEKNCFYVQYQHEPICVFS